MARRRKKKKVNVKVKRQKIYESMIEYFLKKYGNYEVDRSTTAEVVLPDVRIDRVIPIPKNILPRLRNSPFPFLQEVNLIHIKGINDHLTTDDIQMYLSQLNIMALSSIGKGKVSCLLILSSEKVCEDIGNKRGLEFEVTETPWIYEFTGCPEKAYIFELKKEFLEREEYKIFLPFFPLPVIKEKKQIFSDIAEGRAENAVDFMILDWLREIHPKFYKEEIDKMKKMVDVIRGICPEALEEVEVRTKKADTIKALKIRFGELSTSLEERLNKVQKLDIMEELFDKALNVFSLAEFEKSLE